jgi:hypothetical protein
MAMGTIISRYLSRLWNRNDRRVLLVGLDAAGKTTILYHLRLGKAISSIPTVGFNVETVKHERYKLHIWVSDYQWVCCSLSLTRDVSSGCRWSGLAAAILAPPFHGHTGWAQLVPAMHLRIDGP